MERGGRKNQRALKLSSRKKIVQAHGMYYILTKTMVRSLPAYSKTNSTIVLYMLSCSWDTCYYVVLIQQVGRIKLNESIFVFGPNLILLEVFFEICIALW